MPYENEERQDRVDKAEGSGLGMAITKKLTELFGGSITVESRPGKGTTFHIELPMKIASPQINQATILISFCWTGKWAEWMEYRLPGGSRSCWMLSS